MVAARLAAALGTDRACARLGHLERLARLNNRKPRARAAHTAVRQGAAQVPAAGQYYVKLDLAKLFIHWGLHITNEHCLKIIAILLQINYARMNMCCAELDGLRQSLVRWKAD